MIDKQWLLQVARYATFDMRPKDLADAASDWLTDPSSPGSLVNLIDVCADPNSLLEEVVQAIDGVFEDCDVKPLEKSDYAWIIVLAILSGDLKMSPYSLASFLSQMWEIWSLIDLDLVRSFVADVDSIGEGFPRGPIEKNIIVELNERRYRLQTAATNWFRSSSAKQWVLDVFSTSV